MQMVRPFEFGTICIWIQCIHILCKSQHTYIKFILAGWNRPPQCKLRQRASPIQIMKSKSVDTFILLPLCSPLPNHSTTRQLGRKDSCWQKPEVLSRPSTLELENFIQPSTDFAACVLQFVRSEIHKCKLAPMWCNASRLVRNKSTYRSTTIWLHIWGPS
jgi:hypothetical protein